MDLLQVMLKSICVVSMIVVTYGVPIENQTTAILHDASESQTLNTRHNRVTGNSDQSKSIHIRHGKLLPNVTSLKLRGYSSMRMLGKAEIEHPNFDPLEYMKTTGTEPIQNIEIQPDIKMPYFTFGSSNILQTSTNNDGKSRRRRIKRHHPTTSLRSVVGELQNFALVPIKSNNGQIRYILLKNPKFVIGNPSQTGKVAPSIVQLNNNRLTTSSNNQIRYTPVPILPVTKPPYRVQPAISVQRHPRPVPHASPIDAMFSSPTKSSPIIANSHPQYRTDPKPQTHFSAPDIHVQPLHTHDHGSHGSHGSHGNNVVTPSKGDTVQKTEVVETVIETKSAETAAAKQDTAQASSAAAGSQVVATGNGVVGDAGVTSVDTAASSSQSAAASSSSAAKEEKVVKKTKKTTTTVVKAGSDPMAPSGGGAVEQIQVVEETVHAGSSSSVAAASEAAAVSAASSASSATSSNGGSTSGGNGVAEVAVASASNAASSASAAESNSTTTVKKKVVKKTTTITKSTDTSGLAGMNSEIPRAILSDISTKPKFATTKKPPTAILSDSSNKKSTINTKAVLIATDRPKLVAPKISIASTTVPTVSMGTSTSRPMSTEEGEVEPEERTTTLATNTVATSAHEDDGANGFV
ncbi:hypothetical protein ACF0H5_024263 [Mactra antiquata]